MLTALAGQDDDDDGLVGEPDWLQLPLVWVITVGQESCLTMDLSAGEDDARCMVVWEDIADANACITCLGEAGSLPADMEVDISGYEPYGALRVAGGGGYQVAFAPEGVLQGLSDLDVEGIHVELLMNASIFPLDYVAALLRQRQQRADAAAKLDAQRARFAAHKRQGSAGAGSAAAARSTVIEADRVILPDYRRQQGNQAPSPAELGSSSSESDSGDEAGSAADQQGAASRNGSQNGSAPSLNGSRSSQPPPPPPVSSPAAPPAASRTQQYASMARKQEQRPRSQGVEELLERTREFPLPSEHLAAEEQRRQRQAQQAQQAELEQDAAAATGSEEGRRGADAARQSRAEQREGAAQKRREAVDSNWWHMLPYICVPTIAGMDGVEGFLVQDLSSDDSGASHILAFQDRDDADRLIWVLQRWCDEQALRMRVAPFSAAQIRERAELQGAQVMVFRKGQLPLKPGMTQEEVANMAFIYSRT
ncbi:hypothetical protein WJX72_007650 [[Myrmecia] bisecta]|uniref:Uncharacterized protein n=1 Tax=[Myrmecia] bisecta TaxID=41462 RepID=A0AAW1PGI6_9CHLO